MTHYEQIEELEAGLRAAFGLAKTHDPDWAASEQRHAAQEHEHAEAAAIARKTQEWSP